MGYCVRCIVSGRVQGVFFRASTQKKAHQLHLSGHAYNLINGDVEVVACGEESKVKQLQAWLMEGPEFAQVDEVHCEEINGDIEGGFITG